MSLTIEQAIERCKDPMFFIERFFYIVDKQRKRVPFKFNPPQKKYFSSRSFNDLILKARKEGFSSLIEAIWLHACMFFPNIRAVTLSHEMESTKRHFDRVRYYLENMGTASRPFVIELDEDTQKQIKFPETKSSYWIGTAGAKAFGRGDDITHLHLSEVAHYENQDVLTSALEACVPGAWKVMETTANGVGEAFHEMWQAAKDPASGSPWKTHFFAWFDDPTNQNELPQQLNFKVFEIERKMKETHNLSREQVFWYRLKKAEMPDKAMMPQEYPCTDQEAFLTSGRHVFNLEQLAKFKARTNTKPPIRVGELMDDHAEITFRDSEEGPMRVWVMPRLNRSYLIAADVAQGVQGGNYSVAHVLDRNSWEQVATIRMRANPGAWGRTLVTAANFYNKAVVIPENNSIGQGTIEAINDMQYPHLLKAQELWPNSQTPQDGFPTTEKWRGVSITALRNAVDDETICINDLVTIQEMETFIQNEDTGKFEAQKGCQDDCVLSMAIGTYCLRFLTVDETYGKHSYQKKKALQFEVSLAGEGNERRRSATGYR
jgi:hypothetical protein